MRCNSNHGMDRICVFDIFQFLMVMFNHFVSRCKLQNVNNLITRQIELDAIPTSNNSENKTQSPSQNRTHSTKTQKSWKQHHVESHSTTLFHPLTIFNQSYCTKIYKPQNTKKQRITKLYEYSKGKAVRRTVAEQQFEILFVDILDGHRSPQRLSRMSKIASIFILTL